jgi:enterobacteria phage integrase
MAHLRRLRYVNSFVDRHGHARHYFRREGMKAIPLPGPFGSEAFMLAYQMALAGLPDAVAKRESGVRRAEPGTIGALGVSYYRSDAWLNLDLETRKTRSRTIEKFLERHAAKRVAHLRRQHVENMIKEIDGASAKRSWFKAIRPLLQHAVPTMLREDPTFGIATPKLPKTKGQHNWTDAEIDRYRGYWPCGTQQRLVFEFALETLSRRGEVVRLGPQHVYTGSKGEPRIHIARIHGSDDVDIRVSPELMAAIDAMPRAHLTFIVTAYGKPRSKFGLGTDFAKWAREAGLPNHCRLHGLKKAGMRRGAEAGNTTHELMAESGHKTLAEVERYTKGADKRKLADQGMAKRLRAQTGNGQATTLAAVTYNPLPNRLK